MEIKLPLDKLLDYTGNRFELARACMEYVKCVRYLHEDDDIDSQAKEVLVALNSVLDGDIKYTSDKLQIEIYQDEVAFLRETHLESIEKKKQKRSRTSILLDEANNSMEDDEPYLTTPLPANSDEAQGQEDEDISSDNINEDLSAKTADPLAKDDSEEDIDDIDDSEEIDEDDEMDEDLLDKPDED